MKSFVEFKLLPQEAGKKTRVWFVMTVGGVDTLGQIRWYAPWRCYSFMPYAETIYEKKCLRDIAQFCDDETTKHRASAKAA